MTLAVVDARTRYLWPEPYLVYLPGWTEERYLQEAPENAFWEFVHGEVVVHSPVRAEHQRLVFFLARVLAAFLERRRLGEVLLGPAGLRLGPGLIREPDIFVLAPEDAVRARGFPVEARPWLVVEVVSPSTRRLDLEVKPREYADAGIPEYWAVDSEERVLYQHLLERGAYRRQAFTQGRMASQALPGFWLQVDWLWQDPLPSEFQVLEQILAPDSLEEE